MREMHCNTLHCTTLCCTCLCQQLSPPPLTALDCALPLRRTCSGDAFNAELNNLTRASSSKVSANDEADSTQMQSEREQSI